MNAPLESLGMLVKAARVKRGLTQQSAARGAGVSRKQWQLLEGGANVSVVFLRRVATFLELRSVPLGDGLEGRMSETRIDLVTLLHLTDELAAVVERVRMFAFETALPPSERGRDASTLAAYVSQKGPLSSADGARLRNALHRLAADLAPEEQKAAPAQIRRTTAKRKQGA